MSFLQKTAIIQRCVSRIKEVTGLNPERLDSFDTQDVLAINLQRAAQASIDLAAHLVASEAMGVPQDLRENFVMLQNAQVLEPGTSEKMQRMVGFRNIAVHEYQNLNIDILKHILVERLGDFEECRKQVLRFAHRLS
jgi:uncharacterized protein YutE (UPF0331/DUF86 family)